MTLIFTSVLIITSIFVFYIAFFALAGLLFPKPDLLGSIRHNRRFAVMLPAYKEDAVIVDSAKHALTLAYPNANFDVIVIADSLQETTLTELRQLPIQLVEVHFENSTKSKALNAAMHHLSINCPDKKYDVALILDADNVLALDFLTKINAYFEAGHKVVQGHRTAKNTDTPTALLDAISEEINNHVFRLGHRAVGLSAALIGSGMAFDYPLFNTLMAEIEAVGGFDKELEMRLLSQKTKIEYAPNALCFDEKVRNTQVFERQRTRWIAAQIKYLKLNFNKGVKAFFSGNFDYADKVFQTLIPPRVLLIGISGLLFLLALISQINLVFSSLQFSVLLASLLLATPSHLLVKLGFRELWRLPELMWRFLVSFFKVKEAKDKFIHTPHGS